MRENTKALILAEHTIPQNNQNLKPEYWRIQKQAADFNHYSTWLQTFAKPVQLLVGDVAFMFFQNWNALLPGGCDQSGGFN